MNPDLVVGGLFLIAAGIILGLATTLYSSKKAGLGSRAKGKSRGGGVIIIGPFPIVFGSDPQTVKMLLILSIMLVILVIGLFLLGLLS
ncbi:MAG TPA: DUF131 domain-containing protein [Candidatus Binatus sp.]|nr:DUF131 domain-containing protein [Candidatus Binatus sp.]